MGCSLTVLLLNISAEAIPPSKVLTTTIFISLFVVPQSFRMSADFAHKAPRQLKTAAPVNISPACVASRTHLKILSTSYYATFRLYESAIFATPASATIAVSRTAALPFLAMTRTGFLTPPWVGIVGSSITCHPLASNLSFKNRLTLSWRLMRVSCVREQDCIMCESVSRA